MPSRRLWLKASGELDLETGGQYSPGDRFIYELSRAGGESVASFEAHWADWDQRGRSVASVGGRVLEGRLTSDDKLFWRQLADVHDEKPIRMEAPEWAQRW